MRATMWCVLMSGVALGCSGPKSSGTPSEATGGNAGRESTGATGGALGAMGGHATLGGSQSDAGGSGRSASAGNAGATALTRGGTNSGTGGGTSGAGVGNAGVGGSDESSGGQADGVALPAGSREFEGIVNLVEPSAATELEQSILDTQKVANFLRLDAPKAVNLFLDHYSEDYDFLFLFTDHPVDGASFAGRFTAVNRPAEPGGGQEIEIALGGYETTGRLKGIIVVPYQAGVFPPLPHEVLHYWANYLDPAFGFGSGLNTSYGVHWGFAGVNGQLGGFDPTTLRCETPAAAMPPNCTKLSSSRTRYVMGPFAPSANGFRDVPYAPLELYLMGLIPAAEAPQSIPLLDGAELVGALTNATDPVTVEANGVLSVGLTDIIARHGAMAQLASGARRFSSAFAVISAAPATDSVLSTIAEWAAIFGDRRSASYGSSFRVYTGGRATMDTALGARRSTSATSPPIRERFACDVIAQDCGRPELACYLWPPSICVLSKGVMLDAPCASAFDCAPGLVCASGKIAPDKYVCRPYCDSARSTGPKACQVLCPTSYVTLSSSGSVIGAFCPPD